MGTLRGLVRWSAPVLLLILAHLLLHETHPDAAQHEPSNSGVALAAADHDPGPAARVALRRNLGALGPDRNEPGHDGKHDRAVRSAGRATPLLAPAVVRPAEPPLVAPSTRSRPSTLARPPLCERLLTQLCVSLT